MSRAHAGVQLSPEWGLLRQVEDALHRQDWPTVERLARRVLKRESSERLRDPVPYGQAHEALAVAAASRSDYAEIARQYQLALRCRKTYTALGGLAGALWPTGQYAKRLALLEQALQLHPEMPTFQAMKGEMLLTLGRWDEAWPWYEHRLSISEFRTVVGLTQAELPMPRWTGQDLTRKSIVVLQEGGFGDAFHMARYGPLLRDRGASRVVLHVPPGMVPLIQEAQLADEVVPSHPADQWPKDVDYFIPALSLPGTFGHTVETIPWSGPYIPRLPKTNPRPRIGLSWAGAPTNPTDKVRSSPLHHLRSLVSIPDIEWVVFQLGPAGAEARQTSWMQGCTFPTLTLDWRSTVAELSQVDLLISVDTALVHCAGAMGVPTWTLLSSSNDWRWLTDREDTPWYPSMRLWRMRRDWADLWQQVRRTLLDAVALAA